MRERTHACIVLPELSVVCVSNPLSFRSSVQLRLTSFNSLKDWQSLDTWLHLLRSPSAVPIYILLSLQCLTQGSFSQAAFPDHPNILIISSNLIQLKYFLNIYQISGTGISVRDSVMKRVTVLVLRKHILGLWRQTRHQVVTLRACECCNTMLTGAGGTPREKVPAWTSCHFFA